MPNRLIVPRELYDAMVAHAADDHPRECCGLLAGRGVGGIDRAERIYRLVNELASGVEFLSEPRSMLSAVRDLISRGLDVVAVYHSHPTSRPVPSAKDRERNYSEDVVNVIIGPPGNAPEVRGWWLTADAHREADWAIEDGDGLHAP